MSEDVKQQGYAREIAFLRGLEAKLAASDVKTVPKIEFSSGKTACTFYVWGDTDYELEPTERAEKKRLGIEAEIAAVVDLFPGAEWVKNAPEGSYGESYYELRSKWDDLTITILTERRDVCERVIVLEHDVTEEVPDPVLVEKIPLVKVTSKKQIVEWQCNKALAEKTEPLLNTRKQVIA